MVKRKSTKDKLRSTKHTHKTKDRVTRTPLKIEGELRPPGHHSYNVCGNCYIYYCHLDTVPQILCIDRLQNWR